MTQQPPNSMELKVGRFYACNLGYVSRAGQLFMVLNSFHAEDIEKQTRTWTRFYLNECINHLEFKMKGSMRRLVVLVNHDERTVVRGVLLKVDKETGKAMINCVDIGEIREVYLDMLYEATEDVIATKWKTVPCILHGMNMFVGTHFMEKVFDMCDFIQDSDNLRMTIKDIVDYHYVIVLECLGDPKDIKNINTIMLKLIEETFTNGFSFDNKCIGSVTNVTANGMVSITQPTQSESTVLDCVNKFLAPVSADALRVQVKPITRDNIDTEEIYLAEFVDKLLYRAKILRIRETTVEVEYIDYGNTHDVQFSNVFLANLVDPTLATLKPQAKKAYLKWVQRVVDVDKVYDILCSETWKITPRKTFRDGIPTVSLCSPSDGTIVNKTIILDGLATKASLSS